MAYPPHRPSYREYKKPILRPSHAELQQLVAQYDPEDVYSVDEITINWFKPTCPEKTPRVKPFHKITALLCCNSDASDKHEPLILGDDQRRFFYTPYHERSRHSFTWLPNGRGGACPSAFRAWIDNFEKAIGRKTLLIADDIKAHMYLDVRTENVQVVYIEASVKNSFGTPFEGDVRQELERQYQARYRAGRRQDNTQEPRRFSDHFDAYNAADLCAGVWEDLSPTILSNAWTDALARWRSVSSPEPPSPTSDGAFPDYSDIDDWPEPDYDLDNMVFFLWELLDSESESNSQRLAAKMGVFLPRQMTKIDSLLRQTSDFLLSEDVPNESERNQMIEATEGLGKFVGWAKAFVKARTMHDPLPDVRL